MGFLCSAPGDVFLAFRSALAHLNSLRQHHSAWHTPSPKLSSVPGELLLPSRAPWLASTAPQGLIQPWRQALVAASSVPCDTERPGRHQLMLNGATAGTSEADLRPDPVKPLRRSSRWIEGELPLHCLTAEPALPGAGLE